MRCAFCPDALNKNQLILYNYTAKWWLVCAAKLHDVPPSVKDIYGWPLQKDVKKAGWSNSHNNHTGYEM